MGTITLQTIADHLGVSRTTISNAFNRPDQLSDELRDRILETAAALGYTGPHPAARTLRIGRAGALGVVLTESLTHAFDNAYSLDFLAGIAGETEAARLGLYLIPCPPGSDQVSGVRHAVVDGFCVFTLPDSHPVVNAVVDRNLPTVFVDGPMLEWHAFVGIDDRGAMGDLALHLASLGHRHVGVISFRLAADDWVGPVDEERLRRIDFRVTRERLLGLSASWSEVGVEPVILEVGVDTREGAGEAAREMLANTPRPTAIMCLSDVMALGVLDAATAAGLAVPEDLSITGFDGIAEALEAGVTTVIQPGAEKGRRAIQLLESAGVEHELLPYDVAWGSTTGPAPHG